MVTRKRGFKPLPPVVWEGKCLIDNCYGCLSSGLNQMLLGLHGRWFDSTRFLGIWHKSHGLSYVADTVAQW